jgi:hypothetical protein
MLWILIGLTGLSLIIFLTGVIWILVTRGRTYRRSGQEVGKEIMTDIRPMTMKKEPSSIQRLRAKL